MKSILVVAFTLSLMPAFGLSAQAQYRPRVKSVEPARVYPGDSFEIIGYGFGDRQNDNVTVMISATIVDRPYRYKLRVLKWTDRRIRVDTDEIVVPARYSVGIYVGDEAGLVSNTATLIVLGGMVIERISPNAATPGETVELHGRHFGRSQANRIVSINRFGRKNRMAVLNWSYNLIRARIPAWLEPGQYVVLIYYDGSYLSSSDSVPMTIERSR